MTSMPVLFVVAICVAIIYIGWWSTTKCQPKNKVLFLSMQEIRDQLVASGRRDKNDLISVLDIVRTIDDLSDAGLYPATIKALKGTKIPKSIDWGDTVLCLGSCLHDGKEDNNPLFLGAMGNGKGSLFRVTLSYSYRCSLSANSFVAVVTDPTSEMAGQLPADIPDVLEWEDP